MAFGRRDDIVIRYGADDSRFQKVTKRVKATGKDVSGFFGDIGKSIGGFFSRTLAGAITSVGAALYALAKSALSTADALAKTSDKVGVGIENLQRLRYAASTAGVEHGTLDMALQRFSRRIGEAAQGTGVLYKEIVRLGIPLRNAQGAMRSSTAIMLDYADAVKGAESSQEQLRLAFVAFDSEGAALVNLMREGSDGMEELMAKADELGLVIGENLVRESEALNQAWEDFTTRVSTGFKAAMLEAVTWVDRLSGSYRTLYAVETQIKRLEEELLESQKARNAAGFFGTRKIIDYRISRLRDELQQLNAKREVLAKIDQLQRTPAPGGPPPQTGTAAKPGETWQEQLVANRLAAQRNEITTAEYRKRRREIILNADPFGDAATAKAPADTDTRRYVAAGGSESGLKIIASGEQGGVNVIASGLIQAAEAFETRLDEAVAKERVMPIEGELVNAPIDAFEEEATVKGVRTGYTTGGGF